MPSNRFNIPNTDLDSEHVVHGDVGIRYRNSVADFAVSAYLLDYTDRITSVATGEFTPEGREITQSVNAASSEVHGVEATARLEIGGEWFVNANLAYTRGTQQIAGSAEEPADRVPPLSGFIGLEFAPESVLGFEAWASMAGAQDRLSARDVRDSRINPEGTPGWASFGARGHWRPTDAWLVTLELANVFDAGYREHGSGIDGVGRNVSLRIRRAWN